MHVWQSSLIELPPMHPRCGWRYAESGLAALAARADHTVPLLGRRSGRRRWLPARLDTDAEHRRPWLKVEAESSA